MKFQLALDTFDLDHAIRLAEELGEFVDILEIGTPLVLKEGWRGIAALHERFPRHRVLADYKMMDAGGPETHLAFSSGASLVTVCGCANRATIENAIARGREDGGGVMIDMIEVRDIENRLREYDGLGAEYIQIHTAFDGRGDSSPLRELAIARRVLERTRCAVAGGVGVDNILAIAALKPDLVVLGSKIIKAADRRAEIAKLMDMCKRGASL